MKIWLFGAGVVALCAFGAASWVSVATGRNPASWSTSATSLVSPIQTDLLASSLVQDINALEDQALFACLDGGSSREVELSNERDRAIQYERVYAQVQAFPMIQQAIARVQIAERRCERDPLTNLDLLQDALHALDRATNPRITFQL